MSLVRFNPMSQLMSRWPNVWDDELFSDLEVFGRDNLDLYETTDEVVVKANVAGVSTDAVEITFEKGVLWIKAEKSVEQDDKEKKHYSRSARSYSYKVAVPGYLDLNQEPTAEVENGIVTVIFKKAEASKPRKLTVTAKGK